jgi:hypothetical protein
MDPAVNLPVPPALEERARETFFPAGIHPVVNTVNAGQVFLPKAGGSANAPVRKTDKDMIKDVVPATGNPGFKIIGDPFLVPSPLLTAPPALPAILGHDPGISREK